MITDKDIKEETEKDILQKGSLKENPYTLPEGYFSMVENAVHDKIHAKERTTVTSAPGILKANFALIAFFVFILGIGYGVMHLTGLPGIPETTLPAYSETLSGSPDSLAEELLIRVIGNTSIVEAMEENDPIEINNQPINKDYIEQYLIDSDVSLITLASLE